MVHPTQPLPPNRMNECMRDDAECHCLCRDSYYYTYFEAEAKWLNVLCSIVFSDKSAGTTYTIPLPLPPPPSPLDRGLGPSHLLHLRATHYWRISQCNKSIIIFHGSLLSVISKSRRRSGRRPYIAR